MIRLATFVLTLIFVGYYAFGFYLNLSPSQRKDLSNDWLEAGKAFESSGKTKKAIASYKHAFNLYPFGEAGKEAQRILREKHNISLSYTKASFEKYNLDLARKYEKSNYKYSVNAYLMAYDVSNNPEYLYRASIVLYNNNQKSKAKELAQRAVSEGFDKNKVKPELLR
ncbi:MAG: hypothetical protein RMJ37_06710 [Spirochaetia bacterium]|nr:hypothetical protein [Spirochaetota bacterium]MCX8096164.1 hypothetical protein [Spirochaetota bacterium]MDW8113006.1 hypothetical protein [Spirochaetia bacterium]